MAKYIVEIAKKLTLNIPVSSDELEKYKKYREIIK
jgi:hypothetical protein